MWARGDLEGKRVRATLWIGGMLLRALRDKLSKTVGELRVRTLHHEVHFRGSPVEALLREIREGRNGYPFRHTCSIPNCPLSTSHVDIVVTFKPYNHTLREA